MYNTNGAFDYGGFRALAEAMAQIGSATTLFSFQFNDAGTYVFKSSANQYKKMVSLLLIYKCRLLIIFANSLDPDQAQQNCVGPDLGPNCLTL